MRCIPTISAVFAAALAMPGALPALAQQDPGIELPPGIDIPGIDLNAHPVPPSSAPAGSSWEPVPVLPDGAVPGMPTDLPPGASPGTPPGTTEVNPLDKTFGDAVDAYRGRDYARARDLWGELADAGHELSTHNLAVLLWRGQGGPLDRVEAVKKFQDAEELNVPQSAHALGVINLRGIGLPKNAAEAMRHFEIASRLGHAPSTYNLALAHFQGIGVAKDPALGMELLTAAAEGGLARAQYDLAALLVNGTYGPRDPAAARGWYAKAGKGGDPFAHYNLAVMLEDGIGGPADAKSALEHLRISAEAGVAPAQRQLGYVLASAQKPDLKAAMGWFLVAAALGDKPAETNAKRLKPRLDAKTLKAAEVWAGKFRPKQLIPESDVSPEKRTEK